MASYFADHVTAQQFIQANNKENAEPLNTGAS